LFIGLSEVANFVSGLQNLFVHLLHIRADQAQLAGKPGNVFFDFAAPGFELGSSDYSTRGEPRDGRLANR
jgi:hypothetical protein